MNASYGKVCEKELPEKKQQILGKIARLESAERRVLWAVFASVILAGLVLGLVLSHLDLTSLTSREPVRFPPTQFLMITISAIIILISNIAVLVDYFAFELHVERAVTIKKRRPGRSRGEEEESEGEESNGEPNR